MKTLILFLMLAFVVSACSKKVEETKVTISLPKKTYVMYEPINLQFEWINNTSKNDSIWGMFLTSGNDLLVKITDQTGKIYNKRVLTELGITKETPLSYVVAPGDTIFRTYEINDYGIERDDIGKTPQFWSLGYLPAGKYSVTVIIHKDGAKTYQKPIQTNTVEFEVVEAGTEETEIKKMFYNDKEGMDFQKSFEDNVPAEVLKKFPNSKFDETLRFYDIIRYVGKNNDDIKVNANSKADTLLQKYDEYFNRYPNSQYYMYDGFLSGIFRPNCNDETLAIRKKDQLIDKYPNTLLARSLRSLAKYNKLMLCY